MKTKNELSPTFWIGSTGSSKFCISLSPRHVLEGANDCQDLPESYAFCGFGGGTFTTAATGMQTLSQLSW
jgi:hypothetical protein